MVKSRPLLKRWEMLECFKMMSKRNYHLGWKIMFKAGFLTISSSRGLHRQQPFHVGHKENILIQFGSLQWFDLKKGCSANYCFQPIFNPFCGYNFINSQWDGIPSRPTEISQPKFFFSGFVFNRLLCLHVIFIDIVMSGDLEMSNILSSYQHIGFDVF